MLEKYDTLVKFFLIEKKLSGNLQPNLINVKKNFQLEILLNPSELLKESETFKYDFFRA
jgi:hypothetical protein